MISDWLLAKNKKSPSEKSRYNTSFNLIFILKASYSQYIYQRTNDTNVAIAIDDNFPDLENK